jgi:hypothetical protein
LEFRHGEPLEIEGRMMHPQEAGGAETLDRSENLAQSLAKRSGLLG